LYSIPVRVRRSQYPDSPTRGLSQPRDCAVPRRLNWPVMMPLLRSGAIGGYPRQPLFPSGASSGRSRRPSLLQSTRWRQYGHLDCFRVADDPLGGRSLNGYALKRLSVGRVSDQESIASETRFRSLVGSCFTSSQLPNNRGRFWAIALALRSTASK
jgi:hypothetical protein